MDYADELRKWFREAYPSEDANLTVFIQQFVTGRQVLLKGKARYYGGSNHSSNRSSQHALQFGGTAPEEQQKVCPVQRVLQYWP